MKRVILLAVLIGSITVVGCNSSQTNGNATSSDHAARAVEDYLGAKIRGDADSIRAGLCSTMEGDLERESRAFESVSNASIQNMSCASDDPAAAAETVVRCSGEIVALYGTEETKFPLAAYRVVIEDGEWKWCGESE